MTKRGLFVSGSEHSSNKKVRNNLNQIVLQSQETKTPDEKSGDNNKIPVQRECVPANTTPSLYFQAPHVGRCYKGPNSLNANSVIKDKSCEPEKVVFDVTLNDLMLIEIFLQVRELPNVNKQVLQSNTKTTSCPPPPPPPTSDNTKKYLIAAVLAGIGGVGLAYFFKKGEEPSVPGEKTEIPAEKRVPASPDDIPKEVPYLLIGGGTASFTAFRAIKSHEPKAKVLVISNELDVPYMRPPLSKEMWFNEDATVSDKLRFKQWNGAERSLYYEPQDFYVEAKALLTQENGGVAVVRGYHVSKLDIPGHTAILDDGTEIKYGKCLIATGARPRNLDVFEKASPAVKQKLSFYKSVSDFKNLRKVVDKSGSIAVIGGGFLGSELSVALAHYGKNKKLNVHQLFYEKGNMGKVLPEYLSQWTTERVKEEGVDVLSSTQIKSAEVQDKKLKLELNDGRTLLVDHVSTEISLLYMKISNEWKVRRLLRSDQSLTRSWARRPD